MMTDSYKRLELMEIEGARYFGIFKTPLPYEMRARTDKLMVA